MTKRERTRATAGEGVAKSLKELVDRLSNGTAWKLKQTQVRAIANPKTGESIVSRITKGATK